VEAAGSAWIPPDTADCLGGRVGRSARADDFEHDISNIRESTVLSHRHADTPE
jgi:hypothetical protein